MRPVICHSVAPRGRATLNVASPTFIRRALIGVVAITLSFAPAVAHGQSPFPLPRAERIKLSGPRFGITYLPGRLVDSLRSAELDVGPLITQFGWQWERQFNVGDTGPTAVSEWILLVGGLEQGVFLPSLSWIVGLRTPNGTEFGVGPNLGPSGFALALAGGVTRRSGSLNLPFNVSVVPSSLGTRVSLLAGFTVR